MLPNDAIFEKASMGAAYAVDPFCFGGWTGTEDLRDRMVKRSAASRSWRFA